LLPYAAVHIINIGDCFMLNVIFEVYVPLLSSFIFLLGTGFFSTYLAIKMTLAHEPVMLIGSLTGVFYAGLFIGSYRVERFIIRVGHIRAYSVFSSMLAIICLLHGIFYNPYLWVFLRFIAGFATAGLYVVVESWLLCKSNQINRGQVLSLYLIVYYSAQGLGQFILKMDDAHSMVLYAVTSMLCSLSIIPLSMSYVQSPQFDEPSTLDWNVLTKNSMSGLLGCFSSGLIMGALFGLMPTYFNHLFKNTSDVANYMFAVICGGIFLQYPLGRLSDIIERRTVLLMVSLATIVVSVLVVFTHDKNMLFLLMALFGGLTCTLHPISISHAADALDTKDLVAGTQSLLLVYSVGAMLGPFIAPGFMNIWGPAGLFMFFILVCALSIPIYILRQTMKTESYHDESFLSLTGTSTIIAEIDPRSRS